MSATRLSDVAPNIERCDSTVFRASTAHCPALCGSGRAIPHVFWIVKESIVKENSRETGLQRVTMSLVGVLVASLLLVLVAEAQVPVEGYFGKDGTCVQRFIVPSLESNLYNIYTYPGTVHPSPAKCPWQPPIPISAPPTITFPRCVFGSTAAPCRVGKPRTLAYGERERSLGKPLSGGVFLFADVQADTPAHDC